MDVAIVAAARFPIAEPFAGGMEAHTHALAEGLVQRGHDVTVYAAGGRGAFRVRPMLPVVSEPTATGRRDMATNPRDTMAEHHSYLEAVLELSRGRHDLIHLNAVHHLPFACSDMFASTVTATLHCPPHPRLESALAVRARRNRPRLASVSSSNARGWAGFEIDRIIGNGIDLGTWRPGPGGDRAVWTGRLVPEKAPHLAIDACRRAGIGLRLMGPIHDAAYFDEQVRPRLGGDVEYLGHGSTTDLVAVVGSSAVAVVTPTWDEPFGLVVVEALACGTPVAGLARGALPELIDDTIGALATTAAELEQAVEGALRRDRAACRQRAEVRHSAVDMVDQYEQWFEDRLAA